METAARRQTGIVIKLLKAKANISPKGLDGGVCAEVDHPLGLGALEPRCRCRGRVVAASAMPMSFRYYVVMPYCCKICTHERSLEGLQYLLHFQMMIHCPIIVC